jgi:hypothetical protein
MDGADDGASHKARGWVRERDSEGASIRASERVNGGQVGRAGGPQNEPRMMAAAAVVRFVVVAVVAVVVAVRVLAARSPYRHRLCHNPRCRGQAASSHAVEPGAGPAAFVLRGRPVRIFSRRRFRLRKGATPVTTARSHKTIKKSPPGWAPALVPADGLSDETSARTRFELVRSGTRVDELRRVVMGGGALCFLPAREVAHREG